MKVNVDIFTGVSISDEDIRIFKNRESGRKWRANNPDWVIAHRERTRERARERYTLHPEQSLKHYNRYRKLYPERIRATNQRSHYKSKYNLTLEERQAKLEQQGYACAVCLSPFDLTNPKSVCTDHNHETKQVRGLLCRDCNLMLGHGRDSITILQSAIAYLDKYTDGQTDREQSVPRARAGLEPFPAKTAPPKSSSAWPG